MVRTKPGIGYARFIDGLGFHKAALRFVRKSVEGEGDFDLDVLWYLGDLFSRCGMYSDALRVARDVLSADSKHEHARALEIRALVAMGQHDEAFSHSLSAVADCPYSPGLGLLHMRLLLSNGKVADAIKFDESFCGDEVPVSEWQNLLAGAYLKHGLHLLALAAIREAQAADGNRDIMLFLAEADIHRDYGDTRGMYESLSNADARLRQLANAIESFRVRTDIDQPIAR